MQASATAVTAPATIVFYSSRRRKSSEITSGDDQKIEDVAMERLEAVRVLCP